MAWRMEVQPKAWKFPNTSEIHLYKDCLTTSQLLMISLVTFLHFPSADSTGNQHQNMNYMGMFTLESLCPQNLHTLPMVFENSLTLR